MYSFLTYCFSLKALQIIKKQIKNKTRVKSNIFHWVSSWILAGIVFRQSFNNLFSFSWSENDRNVRTCATKSRRSERSGSTRRERGRGRSAEKWNWKGTGCQRSGHLPCLVGERGDSAWTEMRRECPLPPPRGLTWILMNLQNRFWQALLFLPL